MAQKVDLQERLKMRFLTVDYRDKQELYGTSDTASDTGTIALEILNIPDYVLEDLLKLTDPMMQLVDYLNHNRNSLRCAASPTPEQPDFAERKP